MAIYWITKDGRKIDVEWMTSVHINNTLRLFDALSATTEQIKALKKMPEILLQRGISISPGRTVIPRESHQQLIQINALIKSGYPPATVEIIRTGNAEALWNSIKNAACFGDKKAQAALVLVAKYRLEGTA